MEHSPARISFLIAAVALVLLAWSGFLRKPGHLERIQTEGELTIVTRISPTTYYETESGPTGLEYELAKRFADRLGVELTVKIATNMGDVFDAITAGHADLAAAGITVTDTRRQRYLFSEPYMSVHPQLIYRVGNHRPDNLGDLQGGRLEVIAETSHVEFLREAKANGHADLSWHTLKNRSSEDLLYRVWNGDTDYVITDSNELKLNQHLYPELRAAFDLTGAKPLAWAFDPKEDGSLHAEAQGFYRELHDSGELEHLQEKYYGHLGQFDYVGTRVFMRHVTERLPEYKSAFQEAAKKTGIDWRLLAAIGYQESHWDPDAVSPTGVRGVMMLTRDTARRVGVESRVDPFQSIRGGARYFADVKSRLPERIEDPTRTWFALAAYNVGLGHLEDARVITQTQDADPDSWLAVKERLPLLSQRKYYKHTDHGYARGWEPVRYVENVRRYYEILKRIGEPELMHLELGGYAPESTYESQGKGNVDIGEQAESAF